jgi:shikimate kinase
MPDKACRVVLVGMMGSGKSTIGRELARLTGWPYHDNDTLLQHLHGGQTAKTLLAKEGEIQMREAEADALLLGLEQPAPSIVGAAAGTIADERLRAALKRRAIVVWLTASPQTLARRARGAAHRPWLSGDAVAWMTETLAKRAPLYQSLADITVSTERRRPAAIAAQIATALEDRCS